MQKTSLTYRDAGVNIDAGNRSVELIKECVRSTYRKEVLGDLGGFGGLFALDKDKYEEPVLVSGTDGVGTKLKIAFLLDKHDTIGQDTVAMCVNDILAHGAEPLFFLDYVAVGKLLPEKIAEIVSGVARAAKEANCALIGGETAEMHDFYPQGEYDIAGFAVGIVEKKKIISKDEVHEGDVLLGLTSSGLHSNGYSLVRKICFDVKKYQGTEYIDELGRTLGEELLTPTRLYPKIILSLLNSYREYIHGIIHITGGGFYDNIPRALPKKMGAEIFADRWEIPPIFSLLKEWGNVAWQEMFRTFNMGIGMVLIVDEQNKNIIKKFLVELGEEVFELGKVVSHSQEVIIKGGVFDE